jgi:trans-aconitate methyltransferase
MSDEKYIKYNKEVYLSCLLKNTDNHLSVNWGSKESQKKRFEVLMDINKDFIKSSVIDVGCGLGHLVDFLKDKNFQGVYYGIDVLQEMVDKAQRRHPDVVFKKQELWDCSDKSYDYVCMSGVFT